MSDTFNHLHNWLEKNAYTAPNVYTWSKSSGGNHGRPPDACANASWYPNLVCGGSFERSRRITAKDTTPSCAGSHLQLAALRTVADENLRRAAYRPYFPW
jgi:hypothetical protein